MSPKDRDGWRRLAPDVWMRTLRSSTHPIEYATILVVLREGRLHNVRVFDNSHGPEEHHEHRFRSDEKLPPTITYGPVNSPLNAAETKIMRHWRAMVLSWERTR